MYYECQEHRLLARLVRARGPVSYEALIPELGLGTRKDGRRGLAFAIAKLRNMLHPPYRIENYRNYGYQFVVELSFEDHPRAS